MIIALSVLLIGTAIAVIYYWVDFYTRGGDQVLKEDWYIRFQKAFPVQEFLDSNFYAFLWNVPSHQIVANLTIHLQFLVYLLSHATNDASYYLAILTTIASLLEDQLCRLSRGEPIGEVLGYIENHQQVRPV